MSFDYLAEEEYDRRQAEQRKLDELREIIAKLEKENAKLKAGVVGDFLREVHQSNVDKIVSDHARAKDFIDQVVLWRKAWGQAFQFDHGIHSLVNAVDQWLAEEAIKGGKAGG